MLQYFGLSAQLPLVGDFAHGGESALAVRAHGFRRPLEHREVALHDVLPEGERRVDHRQELRDAARAALIPIAK